MASVVFTDTIIVGGTTTAGGAGDEGIASQIHGGFTHPAPYQGTPPLIATGGASPMSDGVMDGGASFARVFPPSRGVAASGSICDTYAGDLYFRIHVIPAVLNLGNVLTNENQDVEVWNAHFVPKTLAAINETDTLGITLLSPAAPPLVFNPGASFKSPYSVLITTDGPATIAAEYEFDFTSEAPTLTITGNRVISFPLDFERPFQERLDFFTDILTSDSGGEQRIRARKLARNVLKVNYVIPDDTQLRSQILNKMYGSAGQFFAVPLFHWSRDLDTDLSIGATVIPVDTTEADFRDSTATETHAIMLWRSPTDFEILQISISGITPTQITVDLPTTVVHTAGDTLVVPLEVALARDPIEIIETRNNRMTLKIQWLLEDQAELADLTSLPTMPADGLPILDDPNFMDRVLEQGLKKDYFLMDTDTGIFSVLGGRDAPQYTAVKGFETRTKAAAWALRQVLYGLRGRQKSFWLSTHRKDFIITTGVGSADLNLAVENVDYNLFVDSIGSWRGVRIELNDGTVFYRQIVSSDPGVIPGEEQITMDSSLGTAFAAADVKIVSLLMLVRGGSDKIDIVWSSINNIQVRLPVVGAPA